MLLGIGAYGRTYKAVHSMLGTPVALKVIHSSFAFDSTVKQRFLAEARALHQLKHSHIAQVTDCGEDDGMLYYVMEYCDGGDLEKLVTSRGALSDESVLLLARQAAKALAFVHESGFLHRDLKPSNLMLATVPGRDGFNLKVIDFGLVKAVSEASAVAITHSGQFLGTVPFASPEQFGRDPLDARSDVFSLGLTMWFLLEGGLPAPLQGTPEQLLRDRFSSASYEERLPKDSHPAVRRLIGHMIQKQREDRMPDMRAVVTAIDDCLTQINSPGRAVIESKEQRAASDARHVAPPPESTDSGLRLTTLSGPLATAYDLIEEDKGVRSDLGARWMAGHRSTGEVVNLTIVHSALAGNVRSVQHLAECAGTAARCAGPSLVRPLALTRCTDHLMLVEEFVEGVNLLNVLRARQTLPLSESAAMLMQMARACDQAAQAGIRHLELAPHRLTIQFTGQRQRSAQPTLTRLLQVPLPRWPAYQMRVEPAYPDWVAALTRVTTHDASVSSSAHKFTFASDQYATFARFVYRVLSGRAVAGAATLTSTACVPISNLSEEGNRLLAASIASEDDFADNVSMLQQLVRVEGIRDPDLWTTEETLPAEPEPVPAPVHEQPLEDVTDIRPEPMPPPVAAVREPPAAPTRPATTERTYLPPIAPAPAPPRKPLPVKLIAGLLAGTLGLAFVIFVAVQWLKPDPIRQAIEDAKGQPMLVIDALKPFLNLRKLTPAEFDKLVRDLEHTHHQSPGDVFLALHKFYTSTSDSPADTRLIEDYRQREIEPALQLWLQALEQKDPTRALKEHIALASRARRESFDTVVKRFLSASAPAEMELLAAFFSSTDAKSGEKVYKTLPADTRTVIARKLAERTIAAKGPTTWKQKHDIYREHGLDADAQRVLTEAAESGDAEAQLALAGTDPTKLWDLHARWAMGKDAARATTSLRWIVDRTDADVIDHVTLAQPALEKHLPEKDTPLDDTTRTIVRKLGAIYSLQWNSTNGTSPGVLELSQFYRSYGFEAEATAALTKAKSAGIEGAWLEWAKLQDTTAKRLAAWLDHADRFPDHASVESICAAAMKPEELPSELQQRATKFLTTLCKPGAPSLDLIVSALTAQIASDKSLNTDEKTKRQLDLYQRAGRKEKVEEINRMILVARFTTAKADFAKPEKRKSALGELIALADDKVIGAEVQAWLLLSVTAQVEEAGRFNVIDPFDETHTLTLSPAQWQPSAKISLENGIWVKPLGLHDPNGVPYAIVFKSEKRWFKLPDTLPPLIVAKDRAELPKGSAAGTVVSPLNDAKISIPRAQWFPGSIVDDSSTGWKFRLPDDLPLLVASFANDSAEPALVNPFDLAKTIPLTAWVSTPDWSRWKENRLTMSLEGQPDHQFTLPSLDTVPELKRSVNIAKCDLQTFKLTSPFTGESIDFTPSQWRKGTAIKDTSMEPLGLNGLNGLKATITLPSERPLLIARLTDQPFKVRDPYEDTDVFVHWSQWKPNECVTKLQDEKGKPTSKDARFQLPADLGPHADPQLTATTPDRINHTIVSPYGGHKVTVEKKDWKPGTVIKDSEYAHLTIKLPADLKSEWFEMKRATFKGNYLKITSPYSDNIVSVTVENWKSGNAKDDQLPFLMPEIEEDPKLEAKVVSARKQTVTNPYTGVTENWELEWTGGKVKRWTENLTYHLPDLVKTEEIKNAEYVGPSEKGAILKSPYGNGQTTLPWPKVRPGEIVEDSKQEPMRVPRIVLDATATDLAGTVTISEPFTNTATASEKAVRVGDEVKIENLTFKITSFKQIELPSSFLTSFGSYWMTLDKKTKTFSSGINKVKAGGNRQELEQKLNQMDRGKHGLPANYRFKIDPVQLRVIAAP